MGTENFTTKNILNTVSSKLRRTIYHQLYGALVYLCLHRFLEANGFLRCSVFFFFFQNHHRKNKRPLNFPYIEKWSPNILTGLWTAPPLCVVKQQLKTWPVYNGTHKASCLFHTKKKSQPHNSRIGSCIGARVPECFMFMHVQHDCICNSSERWRVILSSRSIYCFYVNLLRWRGARHTTLVNQQARAGSHTLLGQLHLPYLDIDRLMLSFHWERIRELTKLCCTHVKVDSQFAERRNHTSSEPWLMKGYLLPFS